MKPVLHHSWDISPADAVRLQLDLRDLVEETPVSCDVRLVAGVDTSVHGGLVRAAVVLLEWSSLRVLARETWEGPLGFPYVPGLLSFREIPPLLHAFERVHDVPDLVFVDGHGRAHPRRFGLACHLGVVLGVPTIGVAKSRLCGVFEEPGQNSGDSSPLMHEMQAVGTVLRSKPRCKPIFVSVGHLVDLDSAAQFTTQALRGYRLPEPARQAHLAAAFPRPAVKTGEAGM